MYVPRFFDEVQTLLYVDEDGDLWNGWNSVDKEISENTIPAHQSRGHEKNR